MIRIPHFFFGALAFFGDSASPLPMTGYLLFRKLDIRKLIIPVALKGLQPLDLLMRKASGHRLIGLEEQPTLIAHETGMEHHESRHFHPSC